MCVCDVVVAEVEVQYSQLDYTQLLDRYMYTSTYYLILIRFK